VLRWTARCIGVAAALVWLVPLVGAVFDSESEDDASPVEAVGVVGLALANVVAVAISLRREGLGGRILLVTGTLFCLFALATAGRNHAFAAAVSGGPFVLTGGLFVLAARTGPAPRPPSGRGVP
jgi:hypothetical protein